MTKGCDSYANSAPAAFAGLFYLSLYLAGKMHLFDNRGEVWKTFVVLVPTLGASLIAVSRIMDARHHPFDVISGSLLGIAVAWCAYRQYFPPLGESWRKGRAFPIRTWGTDSQPVNHGAELIRTFGGPSNNFGQQQEPPDGPGGNVFRQQISRSQRQRQPPNPPFTAVSSTSSLDFEPSRAHLKPLPGIQPQTRHMHHDGYYSSTSDQETDDIELQPQHRGTLGNGSSDQESSGERQANFGQDTSYHPQAQSGGPAVSHTAARSAPLAHTMIRTPVPEPGDDESQRPSGVQLVETYKGQSH